MLHRLIIICSFAVLFAGCATPPAVLDATPAPATAPPTATSQPVPSATALPTATTAPTATTVPTVPTATPEPLRADLLLTGATLLDASGGPPLPNAAVAIAGGKIIAVGHAGELIVAPGTATHDLRGTTLLPGFIDAHAHSYTLTPEQTQTWIRAGVTTVRDLAGPLDLMTQRQRDFAADPALPRLLVAGPMLTVPGGHPIPIDGLNDRVVAVRGPQDATAQVNRLLDAGVSLIKIAVSGRIDTNWPELSNEEIRAITDAAHARGARVTAHVDRAVALQRAVANGIDDAAHMPRDRMSDELIQAMVARSVALIPTIDVYENLAEERGNAAEWQRVILPVMQDNLRRFVAAGGTLALGDDYGNPRVTLGMPLDEIEQWIAAGLTPMQVISAATHDGAIVCGLESTIGTVAPGMAADLLAVTGDPLTDWRALGRPALVIHNGQVVFP